jgi:hypothetical protein
MALFLGHTKAAIKLIGNELKAFAFIANLIAQVTMIGYLSYNLITSSGLWYINLSLLILTLAYLAFTIVVQVKEVKKGTQKTFTRVIQWARRILKLFPIGVAFYSLSLATSNLTPVALISPIIITVMWLLDIIINVLYLVIEARASLIMDSLAEDFERWPVIGNWARQLANNSNDNEPNEKMEIIREMAAAEKAEWDEKMQREKEEKKEERRDAIKGFFSNIFKKDN